MAGGSRSGRNYNSEPTQQQIALKEQEQPSRLPMPVGTLARALKVTPPVWKLLTDTVYPAATTVDGILQALAYCEARGLDVMKRPVHVVPIYNSTLKRTVETVWPGIGELRTTASRTGQWAGTDDVVFGPTVKRGFNDSQEREGTNGKYTKRESCPEFEWPLWAQVTVHKIVAGQRVAFVGPKVIFLETYAGMSGLAVPNAMWRKRPFGQLEKCAEAAALRRAFPEEIGEQYAAEEMEGQSMKGHNGGPAWTEVDDTSSSTKAAAPSRDETAKQRAKDERFVEYLRNGLATANAEEIEGAWTNDEERILALDEDHRIVVEGLFDDARRRVGADAPVTREDIDGYMAEFRRRLKQKQTVADVEALLEREKQNLDRLPQEDQDTLDIDITEHRDAIAAVAASEGGDDARAAEDDHHGQEDK